MTKNDQLGDGSTEPLSPNVATKTPERRKDVATAVLASRKAMRTDKVAGELSAGGSA